MTLPGSFINIQISNQYQSGLNEALMTTPHQLGADPQDEAEAVEDLPLPADTQQQVAGGGLVLEGPPGESKDTNFPGKIEI